jgi:hypothetical protein
MPTDHGLRLDDNQSGTPAAPKLCPEEPIHGGQLRSLIGALQDAELVARGQDLHQMPENGRTECSAILTVRKLGHGLKTATNKGESATAIFVVACEHQLASGRETGEGNLTLGRSLLTLGS